LKAGAATGIADLQSRPFVGWAATDRETEAELHRARHDVVYRPLTAPERAVLYFEYTLVGGAEASNVTSLTALLPGIGGSAKYDRLLSPSREIDLSAETWIPRRHLPEYVFPLPIQYVTRTRVLSHTRPLSEAETVRIGTSPTFPSPNRTLLESVGPDLLAQKIGLFFDLAREERFEDGMESAFSRGLATLLDAHGTASIAAIELGLRSSCVGGEVAQEALRWLGAVGHNESHTYRLSILKHFLKSPFAPLRDAAGLGLAALDDPQILPSLREAIQNETYEPLRQNLQLVANQLEETQQCRSS